MLLTLLTMLMRLRLRKRRERLPVNDVGLPVLTEHPGPQPAFRVLGQSPEGNPDPWDWFRTDSCESVRVLPSDAEVTVERRPLPDEARAGTTAAEAGYRWGSAAAQSGCDVPEADAGQPVDLVPVGEASGDHLPAVRYERAMVALAARTDILATAVTRLQDRMDDLAEQFYDAATQTDLIELESRRARLAAEVTRLSVELRADFDRRLNDLARAMARSNQRSATVDHLGPLDLADARRFEIQADRFAPAGPVAPVTELVERRTA